MEGTEASDPNKCKNTVEDPHKLVQEAREIWLSKCDVKNAKKLYLQAIRLSKANQEAVISTDEKEKQRVKRKRKRLHENSNVLSSTEMANVIEKIALLLIQSGKAEKAKTSLESLGYTCRLSRSVLDYSMEQKVYKSHTIAYDSPCIIIDNFISESDEIALSAVFRDPKASYWVDHKYEIEPPTPYFSYVIPLKETNRYGFVGRLANDIFKYKHLRKKFSKLKQARFVEIWAHNRPHASGHQMHFDSDDEGNGGVRNPIMSTILYVSADSGGPSLVTSQKLHHDYLAEKGYLSFPVPNRLVAFDGKVLHGVVPGKGSPKNAKEGGRRVTVMFAFWKNIEVRYEDSPGSARPFPINSNHKWAKQLVKTEVKQCAPRTKKLSICAPVVIDRVYENLAGERWNKDMGMPEYDQVYQGF